MRDELIGRLIGIARACNNNPRADSTDDFITECIEAIRTDNQEAMSVLIERASMEKNLIVPSCALCEARCGATDDYDMSLLRNASEEIRNIKTDIINAICSIENFTPEAMEAVYYGLFAIGENWELKHFSEVSAEIGKYISED